MSFRDTLLANITASLAGTTVSTSTQLPFECGNIPCFLRNQRKVYLDYDEVNKTTLLATLGSDDVYQTTVEVVGYFALDAKTLPADIDTIITRLQNSRLSITGQIRNDCEITNELESDRIVYTIRYGFTTI